jgi:hypothetical protein
VGRVRSDSRNSCSSLSRGYANETLCLQQASAKADATRTPTPMPLFPNGLAAFLFGGNPRIKNDKTAHQAARQTNTDGLRSLSPLKIL